MDRRAFARCHSHWSVKCKGRSLQGQTSCLKSIYAEDNNYARFDNAAEKIEGWMDRREFAQCGSHWSMKCKGRSLQGQTLCLKSIYAEDNNYARFDNAAEKIEGWMDRREFAQCQSHWSMNCTGKSLQGQTLCLKSIYAEDNNYARFDIAAEKIEEWMDRREFAQCQSHWSMNCKGKSLHGQTLCLKSIYAEDNNYARFDNAAEEIEGWMDRREFAQCGSHWSMKCKGRSLQGQTLCLKSIYAEDNNYARFDIAAEKIEGWMDRREFAQCQSHWSMNCKGKSCPGQTLCLKSIYAEDNNYARFDNAAEKIEGWVDRREFAQCQSHWIMKCKGRSLQGHTVCLKSIYACKVGHCCKCNNY